MGQKERKKRRIRKKRFKLIFVVFIFTYLFFRSVPSLFAIGPKTKLPERYTIENKIKTEAIIVKKEQVYEADGKGKIKLFVSEGERVPVGRKVAELTLLGDTSTLKQRLKEVDDKIDLLTQTKKENKLNNDEADIDEKADGVIGDIQSNIVKGNYYDAAILKDKLLVYSDKQSDIADDNTLINQSLDNLAKQRENIVSQISNNTINYFSNESGIVSFKIDGYESIYSFNNKDNYRYSDFKEWSNEQNQKIISNDNNIDVGESMFKVIDNFEWYMIIKIDSIKDIASYEEGDKIHLIGGDVIGELKGNIQKINTDGDRGTFICRFNNDFNYYYDKRHIDIEVIEYRQDGFKIPKKSVIELNGINGVYIKDISGIIRFRPIEILSKDEDFAYISLGDENNKIAVGKKKELVRTIRQFDEIILNPRNVEEGMIIN